MRFHVTKRDHQEWDRALPFIFLAYSPFSSATGGEGIAVRW
jgi:hypothetical protein